MKCFECNEEIEGVCYTADNKSWCEYCFSEFDLSDIASRLNLTKSDLWDILGGERIDISAEIEDFRYRQSVGK